MMLTIYNLENPYDLYFVGFTDITNLDWNNNIYTQIEKINSNQLLIYYDDIYLNDEKKIMGIKTKKISGFLHHCKKYREIIIVKKGIYKSGNINYSGGGMLSYLADKVVNVNYVNGDIEFEYIKDRNI